MDSLFKALARDASVRHLQELMAGAPVSVLSYGLGGVQKYAIFAAGYAAQEHPGPLVILVHSAEALTAWQIDLAALLPAVPLYVLPESDLLGSEIGAAAHSRERQARRMEILGRLMRHEDVIVLATARAAAEKGLSRKEFARLSLSLSTGQEYAHDTLISQLVALGYERADEVEHVGQFSARGGIVDVFAINARLPVRIEYFGDEIDSLREFSLETKRSLHSIESLMVLPLAGDDDSGQSTEPFLSYLQSADGGSTVIFDEPTRLRSELKSMLKETPELKGRIFTWDELLAAASGSRVFYATLMLQQVHGAELTDTLSITATSMTPFQRQMDLLEAELTRWLGQKLSIYIMVGDQTKANNMREALARRRLPSGVIAEGDELRPGFISVGVGGLSSGFELIGAQTVVITEADIFGHQKRRTVRRAETPESGERIRHFREIKPGDYVVHVSHGIGKYLGVVTLEVGGIHRDYLHIKYGGDDKLYVPTDQVSQLQKYIGTEGEVPRLHRMGGTEWAKAKARAKKSVEDIAEKLIEIYAKRSNAQGFAFSPDDSSQREFEDAFPYQETDDQLKAIAEIKADMEKPKPMDRLLCGDVGFGKTEVAIRAAYKAAMDGKQVAVLVPTTVLAQQHFQTFSERFRDFLPRVDVICRFRTAREQRETLAKVASGEVDILIGTHAILNQRRVKFKDLGLLIVDEEQRFGVKQKDKIRKLAAGIDVLTLSATPIPRTLHMSLVGARDMSIIETPPAERFPVQTYVVENNDAIIRGAMKREIKRGGQVFFVYNRVDSIEHMHERLQQLVPEARIGVAHGQMPEEALERVMMDFYEGEYDILLATSIVENGLDVANANTIIVYNADHFGLSQLYQMRGRVGRSHHMAFAYFVYQADKVLTETAEKRLQAMKEFAELGAGFKIAMRDLEIRGAGNLLGSQQHGHIASVGFEMYCKLLEEAIERLQNGKQGEKAASVAPDPLIDIHVEAYIDGGYIDDGMHKIEIYQRIAALRTDAELDALYEELKDRFGEPTKPVLALLDIARIRNYARDVGLRSIAETGEGRFIDLVLLPGRKLPVPVLLALDHQYNRRLHKLRDKDGYRFVLREADKRDVLDYVLQLMHVLHDTGKKDATAAV